MTNQKPERSEIAHGGPV